MNIFKSNYNFSLIHKISLAGLFIALVTILQKVIAINYIPVIPFVRVSFGGCALIILSSLLLGPWFGLLVGAASDILGYFVFDPKTFGFFPQITAIYAVLGFVSFFIFKLILKIKNSNLSSVIQYSFLTLLLVGISIYFIFNDSMVLFSTTYTFELWQRILIPVLAAILLVAYVLITEITFVFFAKKKTKSHLYNPRQISFACMLVEVLVLILFGSLMKGCAFGFSTIIAIFISQIIVGFINIPMNTLIVSYLIVLFRRFENVSI